MFKKFFFVFMALAMFLPSLAVQAAVCGVDGVTYDSAETAEAAGVDVSYEFACVDVTDESKLYEATSKVNFAGMLIEVGSTDIPTNIIVRENTTGQDYTISITNNTIMGQRQDQTTQLSDWIPGDQIRVIGVKNENTGNVNASILVNLSIALRTNIGANGWITKIDKENKEITYQWMNKEYTFKYDDNTRFVAGLKNPATVDDLKINDRIRARLLTEDSEIPLAKILVVLRRGDDLFMKIRTFTPRATLVRMDSTVIPTTIQVKIEETPGLRANDVNNLIGTEGTLVTVNITEDTRIVRKYFGLTTLDEFSIGDELMIVGRVNDDGTVDAKVIKDASIWKTNTQGHAGIVKDIDYDNNYLMIEWTPIKHLTKKQLKQKFQECSSDCEMTAQIEGMSIESKIKTKKRLSLSELKNRLKTRIKKDISEKVGQFMRHIKNKKIKIDRIKHQGVKLGDLIERLPSKIIRVDINDNTRIVIGTNTNASLSDIKIGDKIRVRGIRHDNPPIVVAETIVVVNSLPEIDDDLEIPLDDINEVVSEIVTDNTGNTLIDDVTGNTDEEVVISEEESVDDIEGLNLDNNETSVVADDLENGVASSTEEIDTDESSDQIQEDNQVSDEYQENNEMIETGEVSTSTNEM